MRLAVIACLAAAPALAQPMDPAPWQDRFDACVHGMDSTAEIAACKGLVARLCRDETDGGHTTLGMTSCNTAETQLWDRLLNEDWPGHRRWAEAADAQEREFFGDQFSDRARTLLEAQRAWIAFRDAQCALEYAVWGSGSMRHILGTACIAEMTADRVIELRALADDMR